MPYADPIRRKAAVAKAAAAWRARRLAEREILFAFVRTLAEADPPVPDAQDAARRVLRVLAE